MLSLAPGHARLTIGRDEEFSGVSESIRALLQVCRLNNLRAALIVSRQEGFDWRSSLRVGLRFAAARGAVAGLRLALVVEHFNDGAADDVLGVAAEGGLECRVFHVEREALDWLSAGAAPVPGAPRR